MVTVYSLQSFRQQFTHFSLRKFFFVLLINYVFSKGGLFTIYERIIAERKRLAEQIQSLESQINTLPKGNLICARNGNRFKWYQSINHSPTYLPKKERRLAEQLAEKKYLSLLLEDLLIEASAIDSYLHIHNSHTYNEAHRLLDMPEYKTLLSSTFQLPSEEFAAWMTSPYEQNPNHPEQLAHHTLSGHFVRSKSEVLIDMALYMNHIPFRYECALTLGNVTLYPDFTIKHPQTGVIYYWEHFGLMDEPAYSKNTYSKLQLYTSHNIIPSIQLITTYETKNHPLSSETIDHIVKEYFC